MLSHEQALVHARQHLYNRKPPLEWVWVLHKGERVKDGWFFYYGLEPLRYIRTSGFPTFGGSPGFVVKDDATVRGVGWWELDELLPRKAPRVIELPETITMIDLAKATGANIYTLYLQVEELNLKGARSHCLKFREAARLLGTWGLKVKKVKDS